MDYQLTNAHPETYRRSLYDFSNQDSSTAWPAWVIWKPVGVLKH